MSTKAEPRICTSLRLPVKLQRKIDAAARKAGATRTLWMMQAAQAALAAQASAHAEQPAE